MTDHPNRRAHLRGQNAQVLPPAGDATRDSRSDLSVPAVTAALHTSGYAAPNQTRKFVFRPAFLQGTSLNILGNTYFVLAGQERYEAQIAQWGEENGVDVSIDYAAFTDLRPESVRPSQAQSGPDIIQMWDPWPYLYQESLVDLTDIATSVGDASGGFYDWVVNTVAVDEQWYSIPYGTSSSAYAYRKSYFAEAGRRNTSPKHGKNSSPSARRSRRWANRSARPSVTARATRPASPIPTCGPTGRWRSRKTARPSPSTNPSSSTA